MDSSSYEKLLDNEDDKSLTPPRREATDRRTVAAYCSILLLQAIVIVWLAAKLRLYSSANDFHLYSPAQGAIEYEVRTFFFDIGDDLSPFQQPPSPKLDKMWQDLYGLGFQRIPKSEAEKLPNITSAIPDDPDGYYIMELDVFHQLHCLNMIRQTLYSDFYPEMLMSKPSVAAHISHCVDSIRQSLMCSSDLSAIVYQWDEATHTTTVRGNVAHTCRNFDLVRQWASENVYDKSPDWGNHKHEHTRVPIYRSDGSSYFP